MRNEKYIQEGVDEVKVGENSLEIAYKNKGTVLINFLTDDIVRVRFSPDGVFPQSPLIRYGFVKDDFKPIKVKIEEKDKEIIAQTKRIKVVIEKSPLKIKYIDEKGVVIKMDNLEIIDKEYKVTFGISDKEGFFGFGDQTRDRIQHYGTKPIMWIENVKRYIPIPFFMSSRGYGMFFNTTWRSKFDIGVTHKDKLSFLSTGGILDYYFIYGPDFKKILGLYTDITGKPYLPPLWSFGLWFICRTQANDFEVVSDALNFRDRKIPCDVLGLEPGWMSENYDLSINKKWHPERFPIPSYAMKGPHTFISAIKRLGFKLELWLCNDYDLSIEEERILGNDISSPKISKEFAEDDKEKDKHFTEPIIMDKLTIPDQPWFEHLKKFIDQGVDFFKQDGAFQVCEHPDRKWANGMTDEEMHNLYPLLYSKQMYLGFKNYTGRRPCGFTPAGWAGLQKFTGTWTGDTGGGPKTLVACLNLCLSGHSLNTCDMEVFIKEGIHYGFLLPWATVDSWNYWRHPWLLGKELEEVFKFYAGLRYKLIPYIYTYAYLSHKTGIPMMRPLILEFPDDKNTWNILTQYMFGEELMVSAFTDKIYLPAGKWIDYWTGKEYTGPTTIEYKIPENRGGGLFVKSGSIIPFALEMDYIGEKKLDEITIEIFPEKNGKFLLYEDDGVSFNYEKGEFCITEFKYEMNNKNIRLMIGARKGKYKGMPETRKYIIIVHNIVKEPIEVQCGEEEKLLTKTKDMSDFKNMKEAFIYNAETKTLYLKINEDKKDTFLNVIF